MSFRLIFHVQYLLGQHTSHHLTMPYILARLKQYWTGFLNGHSGLVKTWSERIFKRAVGLILNSNPKFLNSKRCVKHTLGQLLTPSVADSTKRKKPKWLKLIENDLCRHFTYRNSAGIHTTRLYQIQWLDLVLVSWHPPLSLSLYSLKLSLP